MTKRLPIYLSSSEANDVYVSLLSQHLTYPGSVDPDVLDAVGDLVDELHADTE